jgi:branched-chain amino acid transport system permease protein
VDELLNVLKRRHTAVALAGLIIAVILPFVLPNDYYLFVASTAVINAVFAVSLVPMIQSGRLSLAQAVVVGVGGYTVGYLTINRGWGLGESILSGGLLAVVVMLPIGLVSLRLRGLFFAIATVGFAQVFALVLQNWVSVTGGDSGMTGIPAIVISQQSSYFVLLALLVFMLIVTGLFLASRIGWGIKSLGQDEVLARALGVAPTKHRLISYILSSFIGGIAGGFYASFYGGAAPSQFNSQISLLILAMVVIGGSNLSGAVLGGLFITWTSDSVQSLGKYAQLIQALLFMAAIYFVPKGLIDLPNTIVRIRNWLLRSRGNVQPDDPPIDPIGAAVTTPRTELDTPAEIR